MKIKNEYKIKNLIIETFDGKTKKYNLEGYKFVEVKNEKITMIKEKTAKDKKNNDKI